MEQLSFITPSLLTWLFESTIYISILICFIFIIKALIKRKLPAWWSYCLWLLLLFRMLIPFGVETPVSVYNYVPAPPENDFYMPYLEEHRLYMPFIQPPPYTSPDVIPTAKDISSRPINNKQDTDAVSVEDVHDLNLSFAEVLLIIWFTGVMAFGIATIYKNFKFWKTIKHEKPINDMAVFDLFDECKSTLGIQKKVEIIVTDSVKSPAIFGYIKPQLLLPLHFLDTLNKDELNCVFLHELGHMKRHDIGVSWLVTFFQIIYWFNPLVWYAFHHLRADQEAACDAYVLSRLKQVQPTDYAQTIVSLLERFVQNRQLPSLAGIIENKSQIDRRITMILDYKGITKKVTILYILMLFIVAVVFFSCSNGRLSDRKSSIASITQSENNRIRLQSLSSFSGVIMDRNGEPLDQLNAPSGGKQVEVDAAGRNLGDLASKKPAVPGGNIFLTIDKDLQLLSESLLKEKEGTIVALNPNTGEVLAMASSPAFDPNKFVGGVNTTDLNEVRSSPAYPFLNRAIGSQYPPGSLFKIVIALAGLEEGVIDPEEEVFCNGRYQSGNHIYKCWGITHGGHGNVNLKEALINSCDIYFYKTGMKLGINNIARYARMFGLGQKTNIDLNSEVEGFIPDTEWKIKRYGIPWKVGETIASSIGQGYVSVTPVQMASMISTVFNGGKIFQPSVVKSIRRDTSSIYEFKPTLNGELNVRSENLELLKKALIAVVNDPKGTGQNAKIKGITVAGKTGIAEVANQEKIKSLNLDGDIPSNLEAHAWFVAVAPAEEPQIAISVLVEHGGGGRTAAPIAVELIKQYLKVSMDR
ncbi:MAG: penicillin-binding protein 2 [Deltaproteobacteria bacterium]|nr:penicillin-binding protein 2 [Deltaproteobacteria bacterium]